ncbi:MAG: DNA polymerase III subunit delta' [Frankiaceae bacterium]
MSVWDPVVGQDAAVAELTEAALVTAAARPLNHAWLLLGPAGSGRSVAAVAFAAALECEAAGEPGCGHCHSCTTALAGTHPDVRRVVPEGLSIGVDVTRDLVRAAASAPTVGRVRILVVEDADRLTEQAGNALLKALEEPAVHTVFVLCAPSDEDVLPTVRSRCRIVRLRVPDAASVAALLVREGTEPAVAAFVARAAQGHVGRARWLAADEGARRRRAEVLKLPSRLRSPAECLAAAADLVDAAAEEARTATAAREQQEMAALRSAYGAGATSGPAPALSGGSASAGGSASSGGSARSSRAAAGRASTRAACGQRALQARGAAGAVKELETAQRRRGKRTQLDALDRALIDLAGWYRDVLVQQLGGGADLVHPDQRAQTRLLAERSPAATTLRRIEAVLACREALGANASPLLAVENLMLDLH